MSKKHKNCGLLLECSDYTSVSELQKQIQKALGPECDVKVPKVQKFKIKIFGIYENMAKLMQLFQKRLLSKVI